jgi:hypothetical protein
VVAASRDVSVHSVDNVPDFEMIVSSVSGDKINMFYVSRMQIELFSVRGMVMFVKQKNGQPVKILYRRIDLCELYSHISDGGSLARSFNLKVIRYPFTRNAAALAGARGHGRSVVNHPLCTPCLGNYPANLQP